MCKSSGLFLWPMKKSCFLTFLFLLLGCTIHLQLWGQREVVAAHVSHPPKLDGILEPEIWQEAPVAGDFISQLPVPGLQMREASEVKVIYTQEAIYIGFNCLDSHPDSILKQLSGRDNDGNSDWCAITFNCYKDGINGYTFAVSPWGEQWDGRVTGNNEPDVSWNAVWDCKVKITSTGWCAEFKIPFAALRFPAKSDQEWHINFAREIRRYRQIGQWNPVLPNGPGDLAQMGHLKGITNINPPKRFFMYPYLSAYANYGKNQSSAFSYNGGMDVKIGLSDAFTMDATLIPDFGQTISDQLILNLTPFEIQFQDNRQFFMEGTELFNKSGIFYSRRIGDTPMGAWDVAGQLKDGESVTSNPMHSQLLNSTKISGRTKRNLGIGFMNSITASSYATVRDSLGNTRDILTQPLSNSSVLVLDQNLKHNSYFTLTNTNVTRKGDVLDANVTAYNTEIRNPSNRWSIASWGAFSHRKGMEMFQHNAILQDGFTHGASFSKISGNLTGSLGYYLESDQYNPNDLGYLQVNNSRGQFFNLGYKLFKPFGPFNKLWSSLNVVRESLYAPKQFSSFKIDAELGLNTHRFTTYNINYHGEPIRAYNYFEPRIWGMKFHDFTRHTGGGWISSDYRKKLAIDVGCGFGVFGFQDRFVRNWRVSPRYRVNDHWMLIYVYSRQQQFNDVGFSRFSDDGTEPIFGRRDVISHTNVLTLAYSVNPLMSLNCRVRHYWGFSRYHQFYQLDAQGELVNTDFDGFNGQSESFVNRNFNSFTIDCFLKWNFRPGSECVVAWKWSQIGENNIVPVNLWEDATSMNYITPTGSLSVRLVYFLDYRLLTKNKGEAMSKFM